MKTNKKSKNLIGIIQSFLILILVVLIIFMMIQISRLQGTARVINYAGLVRGATQCEIKLEITGNQNDELISGYLILFQLNYIALTSSNIYYYISFSQTAQGRKYE